MALYLIWIEDTWISTIIFMIYFNMFKGTFRTISEAPMNNILLSIWTYLKSIFPNIFNILGFSLTSTLCKNRGMHESIPRHQNEDLRSDSKEQCINILGGLLVQ